MKDTSNKNLPTNSFSILKWAAAAAILITSFNVSNVSAQLVEEDGLKSIYHIYNSGKYLGSVADGDSVKMAVEEKISEVEQHYEDLTLQPNKEFIVLEEQVFKTDTKEEKEVMTQVAEGLDIQASAFALVADGETIVYLKDRASYDETLRQLKSAHVTPDELKEWETNKASDEPLPELAKGQSRITDLFFAEKVSGLTKQVAPEKVMTVDEAAAFLLENEKISVNVHKEQKEAKAIAHKSIEKDDKELLVGKTKVKEQGKDGQKELTFAVREENGKELERTQTDEQVIAEPIDEIILNGTKPLPTIGTGTFAWPADGGYISSGRGERWGRLHNGIDIARPETLTIKSADHGVVKAAGAAGTFGNRVVVDHQNGYETIYAHLSKIDVKTGDKVPKGTKLGDMGTTGRSTGLHLHFEVSLNGTTQNPLNYLN